MDFRPISTNMTAGDATSHYIEEFSIPVGDDTSARCNVTFVTPRPASLRTGQPEGGYPPLNPLVTARLTSLNSHNPIQNPQIDISKATEFKYTQGKLHTQQQNKLKSKVKQDIIQLS